MSYRVTKWFKITFIAGLVLSSPLFMLLAIDRLQLWQNYRSMPVPDLESVLDKAFEDYGPNQQFELADVIDQFDWQYMCTTEQYRRASHSVSRDLGRDITDYKFLPRNYTTRENRSNIVFVDDNEEIAYVYPMVDNIRIIYSSFCMKYENSNVYIYEKERNYSIGEKEYFEKYLVLSVGIPD